MLISAKDGLEWIEERRITREAQIDFDVFLTGDRNLTFQQDLTKFDMAIVVLQAESIQLEHLLPLIPKVLTMLPTLAYGQVVYVSAGN